VPWESQRTEVGGLRLLSSSRKVEYGLIENR
jgi:hypothetical protein